MAFPSAKGSGAVTSFSQADGFIEIDALAGALDADTQARVTLIGESARAPDVVIMGSHDIALDVVVGALAERGYSARTIAVGSQGGVAAAERGQCDIAPVHLIDPATGEYNKHLLSPGISLVKGWQRMQGVLFRPGDKRFEGKSAAEAAKAALADPSCLMVNRNAGAGTRVLIDQLLAGRAAAGLRQPAALAQRRRRRDRAGAAPTGASPSSRWRKMYGLGFLPLAPEHYDFLLVESRRRAAGGAGVPRRACATAAPRIGSRRSGCSRPMTRIAFALLAAADWPCPAQAQLRGHGGPVRALAISADGKTAVSGSFDTSAIRWSLTRNAAEQVLRFHDSAVNAVALAPDGRIVTGGARRQDRDLAARRDGAATRARRPRRAGRQPRGVAGRRDARLRIVGPHASGCGRSRAARRACWRAISRTSTAWRSRPTARRWSAPPTT